MATLDEATKPVDTSKMTLVEPSQNAVAPPENNTPGVNPFLRSPMPLINATPDSLRQFYTGGVPQARVMPAPVQASRGQKGSDGAVGATGATSIIDLTKKAAAAASLKRETVSVTTASLATDAVETGTVPLGLTFSLLEVTATNPCRVRLYSSSDKRDSDAARGVVAPDVYTEHGVIFDLALRDVITRTYDLAPGASWVNQQGMINGTNGLYFLGLSPVTAGQVVQIRNDSTYDAIHPASSGFYDASYNFISDIGSIPASSAIAALVPAGAVYVGTSFPDGFGGSFVWGIYVATAFDVVITGPYPMTWICSPEALGSDCADSPVGNIAYAITSLDTMDTTVTVDFVILKEEK